MAKVITHDSPVSTATEINGLLYQIRLHGRYASHDFSAYATHSDENVRSAVAGCRRLSEEARDILCVDPCGDVQYQLASSQWWQNLNAYHWGCLAESAAVGTRRQVAWAKAVPDRLLPRYAFDDDASLRAAVARIPRLDEDTMWSLARDDSVVVRWSLVGNDELPYEILVMLSQDQSSECRATVAESLRTPPVLLQTMIYDTDAHVLAIAAHNTNMEPRTLHTLAVRILPFRQDDPSHIGILIDRVANNPNTATQTLTALMHIFGSQAVPFVVKNHRCTVGQIETALDLLTSAHDRHSKVLQNAFVLFLQHRAVTSKMLEQIVPLASPEVLLTMTRHPLRDDAVTDLIFRQRSHKPKAALLSEKTDLTSEDLAQYATSQVSLREAAAGTKTYHLKHCGCWQMILTLKFVWLLLRTSGHLERL